MTSHTQTTLVWVLFSTLAYAQDPAQQLEVGDSELKTLREKVSYGFGVNIGRTMLTQNVDVNPQLVAKGMIDVLSQKQLLLSNQELAAVMGQFQQDLQMRRQKDRGQQAEKNVQEGQAFLEANKKKEGVQTSPSGLQYQALKAGVGPVPKANDHVRVHYEGKLLNGKVFDSSYQRGEPITFPLSRVIPGWTEGLQKMKVGSKYRLFVPPNLAYGQRGSPPSIGPNATLVFDVELLGIEKPTGESP